MPITITKEHTNAVTRAMSAGITSFGDGDAMLSAAFDPESFKAREAYVARSLGGKGKRG